MSPTAPNPEPGLCGACRWARLVPSARGSTFLRCGRSDLDARFRRYPPLPVRACAGFEAREAGGRAGDAGDEQGPSAPAHEDGSRDT